MFANAHRAFKAECIIYSSVDYITLDKAVNLLRNGELNQKVTIEERVK